MSNPPSRPDYSSRLERRGRMIPDPVLLFAGMYVQTLLAAVLLGGHSCR